MVELKIALEASEGTMETFVCHPEDCPSPVVLVFMDGPGIREDLRDVARRLAGAGLLPLWDEVNRHGVDADLEVLPDADHGYSFRRLPAYRAEAAERAWKRTLELFGRRLGAPLPTPTC